VEEEEMESLIEKRTGDTSVNTKKVKKNGSLNDNDDENEDHHPTEEYKG
jgi:hypothetical protein